jgi:diacylglycerol kinase family enzyme
VRAPQGRVNALPSIGGMSSVHAFAAARAPQLDGARAPIHLVVNHRSGAVGPALRERLDGHPGLARRSVRWHQPQRSRDLPAAALAAARTAQRNGGIVIAAGGDGTINAVAQAAWALGVPMGVLPRGTFNFFSRQHGLAEDAEQALGEVIDSLSAGSLRPVRVGLVNDRLFLVNASLGLYPRLLAEREAATRRWGRSRAVVLAAAVASLFEPASVQRLRLVDHTPGNSGTHGLMQISTLFVGANALQLQAVGLREAAPVSDGALAAVTLAPQTRMQTLRMLWRALRGRLADEDSVHSLACTRLEVQAAGWRPSARLKVAYDGETSWMRLPLRFAVGERPLWLVAPPLHAAAQTQPFVRKAA